MSSEEYRCYCEGFQNGGRAAIVQVRDIAKHHPLTTRGDLVEAMIAAIEAATQTKHDLEVALAAIEAATQAKP
jgi:hypothetical protein